MTTRRTLVALAIATLTVTCVTLLRAQKAATSVENTAEGHAAEMPKWEYKVLNDQSVQELDPAGKYRFLSGLNVLGTEGWELVVVTPGIAKPTSLANADRSDLPSVRWAVPPLYYFKRLLR